MSIVGERESELDKGFEQGTARTGKFEQAKCVGERLVGLECRVDEGVVSCLCEDDGERGEDRRPGSVADLLECHEQGI
mgnify:CR=1 FL=1